MDNDGKAPVSLPRTQLLQRQMQDYHSIGIQEARSSEETKLGADWYRIAAGSARNSGNPTIYGIELWINLILPINADVDNPIFLKAMHFTIIHT